MPRNYASLSQMTSSSGHMKVIFCTSTMDDIVLGTHDCTIVNTARVLL